MTAEELFNAYLNESQEDRLRRVSGAAQVVFGFLKQTELSEEEQFGFFVHVIGMFVAADGQLTRGELELFNALFDASYTPQQVAELLGNCARPEVVQAMDELIDSMPEEAKLATCSVGLAFAAADGQLTEHEVNLFAKILQ